MVGDLSSFWHDGTEKPDTAAASDDYRLTQTEPSEMSVPISNRRAYAPPLPPTSG